MPTTRPRYPITETDEISVALLAAAKRWPEDADSPRMLLLHLIAEGAATVSSTDESMRRRAAIEASSGAFTEVYGPGYVEELHAEWPA